MVKEEIRNVFWALSRISMGFIFLWAFFDKLLGLGFATCRDRATGEYLGFMCERAFVTGAKVTPGYLSSGVGPFAPLFNVMSGNVFVEWLFMFGLLGIGLGLLLGVAMGLTTYSGSLMMFLMWLVILPKDVNPFMDEHIIFIFFLLLMNWYKAGTTWGLGKWWNSLSIVKKHNILH